MQDFAGNNEGSLGPVALLTASKLDRAFYARDTLEVARELIGMHLVHVQDGCERVVRIVETEAYQGPEDLAAHSARGLTPRTRVMFGEPGFAYVYFIYGVWHCFNVVTQAAGIPHAVLVRAGEPIRGITEPAWGPGLLCHALGIDRQQNGLDLCGESLWIERPVSVPDVRITTAARIGVDYAGEWAQRPWRFFDSDSPHVSTVTAAKRRKLLAAPQRFS